MGKRTYTHWTVETLTAAAKKYSTLNDFHCKNPAAYMAAKRKGLFKAVTAHMTQRRFVWTDKLIKKEASKFTTRSDFAKGAKTAYGAAVRLQILDEVCSHMPKYAGKGKKRGPNKRTTQVAAI